MPPLFPLPDECPDTKARTPEESESIRQAKAILRRMETAAQADVARILLDRLSAGCLAAALMDKKGRPRALMTSGEVAVLFGWCATDAALTETKRASERVRNEVHWACVQCECHRDHVKCPWSCALLRGRVILRELNSACKDSVSPEQLALAARVINMLSIGGLKDDCQ
jgi:hypothetical protein